MEEEGLIYPQPFFKINWENPKHIANIVLVLEDSLKIMKKALELQGATGVYKKRKEEEKEHQEKEFGGTNEEKLSKIQTMEEFYEEIFGEKYDKEKDDGWCFIATASIGTPFHPKLDILREFRDKKLMKSFFGKFFVKFYYRVSPPIAKLISKSEKLRNVSRKIFVEPLVKSLEENRDG